MADNFHLRGIPGVLAPLTETEERRVEKLLEDAQPYIVPLKNRYVTATHFSLPAAIGHFNSLSPEERSLLVRWTLLHHQEADNFNAFHRTLRIFSGVSNKALASALGYKEQAINQQEKGAADWSPEYVIHFFQQNPCNLPQEPTGEINSQLRAVLKQSFHLPLPSTRDQLLAEVEMLISAYKRGDILVSALPTQLDIYTQLKPADKRWDSISAAIFPDHGKTFLYHAIDGGRVPEALWDHLDLTTAQGRLISMLPCKSHSKKYPLKFSENHIYEMTQPIVHRVFNHPERYGNFGLWLDALIEASQQDYTTVARKVLNSNRVSAREKIQLWCRSEQLGENDLSLFLRDRDQTPTGRPEDFNPLHLPADEITGKIEEKAKAQFINLGLNFFAEVRPHLSAEDASHMLFDPNKTRGHSSLHPTIVAAKQQAEAVDTRGSTTVKLVGFTGRTPVRATYDVDGELWLDEEDIKRFVQQERRTGRSR